MYDSLERSASEAPVDWLGRSTHSLTTVQFICCNCVPFWLQHFTGLIYHQYYLTSRLVVYRLDGGWWWQFFSNELWAFRHVYFSIQGKIRFQTFCSLIFFPLMRFMQSIWIDADDFRHNDLTWYFCIDQELHLKMPSLKLTRVSFNSIWHNPGRCNRDMFKAIRSTRGIFWGGVRGGSDCETALGPL